MGKSSASGRDSGRLPDTQRDEVETSFTAPGLGLEDTEILKKLLLVWKTDIATPLKSDGS